MKGFPQSLIDVLLAIQITRLKKDFRFENDLKYGVLYKLDALSVTCVQN